MKPNSRGTGPKGLKCEGADGMTLGGKSRPEVDKGKSPGDSERKRGLVVKET